MTQQDVEPVLEELGSDNSPLGLEAEPRVALDSDIKAPFDPAKIDVITQMRTVDLLLTRLREGEMNLSPDFQRRANLWNDAQKSSLIESLLLRIPIPSLYVSEDEKGDYTVVDGLQRMCAIAHFVEVTALNNTVKSDLPALRLKDLQSLSSEFSNATYEELPRSLQRRINETELTLHVIRASTPPEVKFNIFSRINRGGLPLSAQEIRNAIFQGAWQEDVRALCESVEFLEATSGSIRGERMQDTELVLRFLAHYSLHDMERPPDQNLDDFLNEYAQKSLSLFERIEAKAAFTKAMVFAIRVFGKHAFRKYYGDGEARKPINRGLFEAESVVLSRFSREELEVLSKKQHQVLDKLAGLFDDSDFSSALLYATGRGSNSNLRIEKLNTALREIVDAD